MKQAWAYALEDELRRSNETAEPPLVRFAGQNVLRSLVLAAKFGTDAGASPLLLCRDRKKRRLLRSIDDSMHEIAANATWRDWVRNSVFYWVLPA